MYQYILSLCSKGLLYSPGVLIVYLYLQICSFILMKRNSFRSNCLTNNRIQQRPLIPHSGIYMMSFRPIIVHSVHQSTHYIPFWTGNQRDHRDFNIRSYLDLLLFVTDRSRSTKYDKRDDFDFRLVNVPDMCSNIPESPNMTGYTWDFTADAWPQQENFTLSRHLFPYLGFSRVPVLSRV